MDTVPGVDQIGHLSWVKSLTKSTYLIDFDYSIKNGKFVENQPNLIVLNLDTTWTWRDKNNNINLMKHS